jgi:TRAP-type mannitol/chloroaromatic compound transport system substrate-binding protein
MNSRLRFGSGADLLNQLLKNFNCTGVAAANTGAQMGGWYRKEIKSLDDLKGLKMRIGGFAGTIVSKLGVGGKAAARRTTSSTSPNGTSCRRVISRRS